MKLRRLAINRLPGISQPFEIKSNGPGIHVIFGPNGIGKSSICRAVECLYWKDRGPSRQTFVTGEFESGGEIWRGEREGSTLSWSRGSNDTQSPNLPPAHNHRCFFLNLRDLIDTSADGASDIAAEIHRQMSGGFDLGKISGDLFPPVTHRRKRAVRDKFNRASDRVRLADTDQSKLQQRVDQLQQLQSALDEAEIAAGRLSNVDRAIGLAKRQEKLAEIEKQLGQLPGVLANLTGKECDDVNEQQGQLSRLKERARGLERDLQDARKGKTESGLPTLLKRADLATWRDESDEMGRIDQALEAARNDHEKARRRVSSALAAIGGGDIDTAVLSLPEHGRLFEFLRASQTHSIRVDTIREKLRLLSGSDSLDADEQLLARFRNAADALRLWLRQAEPGSPRTRIRARLPWIVLALVLLPAGTFLAFAVDPILATIAALGVGIGLAALFMGNDPEGNRLRRAAQATYENLGHEEPSSWDVASVAAALRSLEHDTAKLEASLQRERDRGVERKSLENEFDGFAEQQELLDTQREELRVMVGLELPEPDAELVDFARALDELRSARAEYDATLASVQRLENNHNTRLEKLADALGKYGESRPESTAAAKARLNDLSDRNSLLEKALAAEQTTTTLLEQNGVDQNERHAAISGIFDHANLPDGDSHGLRSLLEDLPQFRALEKERKDLESKIDLDRSELAKSGEADFSEMSVRSLEELKSKLEHAKSQTDDLRQEISNVNAEMRQAQQGRALLDLIAAREEARADLQNLRDQALFASAGYFLIKEIEHEYEQTRMPQVFERARDHFSEFTQHNYELDLERGNGYPELIAIDLVDRQRRKLDELSDGTRAQLLLAARVAFAEEVEQGEVLPLFLDEALDQSDPKRFEAIARSLGCIARDQGRQIFYLTSDPLDVDRIRVALGKEECEIAAAIDLGLIRTVASSVSGPEKLTFEPPAPVPAPNGFTPTEYGTAIRASAFRPMLGFAGQHLFYVLSDDLDLLHACLENGIERAGQWKTVAQTSLATRLEDKSVTAREIGWRLDLLEVFCELWNQGRGKPVDRDALLASHALTPRFFDDVAAIARELDGDPERLVDELAKRRDSRLRRFQSQSVDRLKRYLIEHEYIDDRSILTENELQLRALATPAANSLPDGVAIACTQRWWQWAGKSSEPEAAEQAG